MPARVTASPPRSEHRLHCTRTQRRGSGEYSALWLQTTAALSYRKSDGNEDQCVTVFPKTSSSPGSQPGLSSSIRAFIWPLLTHSVDLECPHDYPSRDTRALASGRLSLLLALEVALGRRVATAGDASPRADPADQHREPAMGRTAHPRRTAQARLNSSVANYMVKPRVPPSQGWRTFLRNYAPDISAMDLFIAPTIGFDLLYAFVIVRLDRRDLVWINVTANPTAEWIAPDNRGISLG